MRLTFLGTAGSWPTKERNASALAVELDRELVLFDCGEGTQRQLFHSVASFMRVRRIFLSHFHGDHFLGLPGLVQSMNLNHRTEPLDIYGPTDAKEMVGRALALGYYTQRFPITVHALSAGESLELDGYTVRTARADHPVPSLAYRLEEAPKRGRFDVERARALGIEGRAFADLEQGRSVRRGSTVVHPEDVLGPPRPGRSVVYSGDTAPTPDIERLASGALVLVHEATVMNDLAAEANEWGHSSAQQAAELARSAHVQTLYLTHFSSRYKDVDPLAEEARRIFPSSFAARDLAEHLVRQP